MRVVNESKQSDNEVSRCGGCELGQNVPGQTVEFKCVTMINSILILTL